MHFYFLYLLFKQIYQILKLILSSSNIGTAKMNKNYFAFPIDYFCCIGENDLFGKSSVALIAH